MTVTIADQTLEGLSDLDAVHQTVLALIPHGPAWLDWALREESGVFGFTDADTMLISVLEGLHNTGLLSLKGPGVWASPSVLTAMAPAEVQIVFESQNAGRPVSGLKKVLTDHGLYNFKALAAARALPESLGVGNSPCFQTITPGDLLLLAELADRIERENADARVAAAFAAGRAVDVSDFTAYTAFKQACGDADATTVLLDLMPSIWAWLRGPVAPTAEPHVVTETVTTYLQHGGLLGFSDLATAARYLAEHVPLTSLGSADRPNACAAAVQAANAAAASFVPDVVRISQDGQIRRYTMQTNGLTLERNPGGVVTIHDYRNSETEVSKDE
ncbi:MAG: hypothetical protein QNK37_20195 [Acidobacteriota bacterium]|nr:hypothetical protein [Acidobacteriota bacterium]